MSEAGVGTAPSNEESKPTTENTETKQVLRLIEKFWFEGPLSHQEESGPMLNPNPAFLLVQKLKLNQPQGHTRGQG